MVSFGSILIPKGVNLPAGDSSYDDLDAAGERIAQVFYLLEGATIRSLWIRTQAVFTGKNLKLSIQSLNDEGDPSGTILGATGRGYATATIIDTDDNKWNGPFALGEDVTLNARESFAVVVEWSDNADSGIIRIGTAVSVNYSINNQYVLYDTAATLTSGTLTVGVTYRIYNYISDDDFTNVGAPSNATDITFVATGTTPTRWTNSSQLRAWSSKTNRGYYTHLAIALEDTVGHYPLGVHQVGFGYSLSVSTTTNPDEVGNYFKLPAPVRAIGVWILGDLDYNAVISLQSSDGTILANVDYSSNSRGFTGAGLHLLYFDSDPSAAVSLAKDTYYRVVCTPITASSSVLRVALVPEAAAMESFDFGGNCIMTQRVDAGEWSQDGTRRVNMGIIADQIDDGTGGGGGGGLPILGGSVVR